MITRIQTEDEWRRDGDWEKGRDKANVGESERARVHVNGIDKMMASSEKKRRLQKTQINMMSEH